MNTYDCLNICYNIESDNCSMFATDFYGNCYFGNLLKNTTHSETNINFTVAKSWVILHRGENKV